MRRLRPGFLHSRELPISCGDERGFTLIETILALSILVVMIGLVLSSVRLGQKSWQKGEGAIEEAETRRFIIKRLGTDIASMYPYKEKKNGEETYIFKGAGNELTFVTSHLSAVGGLPWGGAMMVSYSAGENGLKIKELTLPLAEDDDNRAERTVELGPAIKSLRFSYLGDKGWLDYWDMRRIKELPGAVRIECIFTERIRPLSITMPVGVTYPPGATKNSTGSNRA
ncbi:MAG: type II secretion system protein GspJ [Thermodesulfobacteriota bacterium]